MYGCYIITAGLFFIFCNSTRGEWVEMPQFSDETKIYRIPSSRYNHFLKFMPDGSQTVERYRNVTDKYENIQPVNLTIDKYVDYQFEKPVESSSAVNAYDDSIDSSDDVSDIYDSDSKDEFSKLSNDFTEDTALNDDGESITIETEESILERDENMSAGNYWNETLENKGAELFDYLPIEVIKSVHRTLKSQPMTSEGKMHFLKTFENTLMSEIETRLSKTMAPTRKVRGATDHYDHGYDDHDEYSLGFPSIEGALMAISFLTFAVYLVRLVMLLFRNMNNPSTSTNGNTVFLGKRKRSVDHIIDDATQILQSMDNFLSKF